jgi:glutamine amidotransferase
MKVVIIKYNAGNIRSVDYALKRLGVEAAITGNFDDILSADKVIFPGVGEAATTMSYLKQHKLDELIVNLKQPVLGICLGLQLMCRFSEEGNTECLGIFDEQVNHFDHSMASEHVKVPHMGWNKMFNLKTGIFDTSLENEYVYFVHSYYAALGEHTAATTNYIVPFSAALHRDNFYATQFHPEKSGNVGSRVLENFLKL